MSARETIVEFLTSIGITVSVSELTEPCFLPGIRLSRGAIIFDPERMLYPGDLLHEAGHLAVLPEAVKVGVWRGEMESPGSTWGGGYTQY